MSPNSDTKNDAEPSGNDNLSADESEREESERRGKGKGKEDDSTQYSRFQTRHGLTNQASCPVSENSVECHRFNKSLPSLIECLGRSNTKRVSIDCLGRRWSLENKQSKIRTTVVISFSQYPDRAEELKRDLQMAMKDNGLPIEFIQGKVTRHVTMEDMRWFLKLHYYELQIPLRIIQSLPEPNGRGIELFADVIRTRRLQRERPKLSRIIEHPENMDSESVIERINKLLHPRDGELPVLQDTEPLRRNRQRVRDHMRSANRLISTVWASSGLERRPRRQGRLPPLVEDWALIKLFRNDGQQFQNRFGANLLRPRFRGHSFTGVRELPSAARIAVTKRGSTTDLTVGTTNGAPSVIHEDGYLQSTFTIVATPHTTQFFSASGDSGSWIMDRTGQLVGMMWGGRNKFLPAGQKEEISGDLAGYTPEDLEVEDVTYYTTAKYIFRWIEESFKEWRRILGEEQPQHFERKVQLFS
ncbi:hypothetical protein CEP53_010441 [Fusarium sp. AF-6]|nr:hypothetical protein CEP53_010441 [Fusarium sp. AF-6]